MRLFVELKAVSSTNAWLKEKTPPVLCESVRAVAQIAGQGRRGRTWFSGEPDENLAFSMVVPYEQKHPTLVPLRAALALHRALKDYLPLQIKWPNDLVRSGRKLGGVLCESHPTLQNAAIVGVGINVHARIFPAEIKETATSLYLQGVKKLRVRRLWLALSRALKREFEITRTELDIDFIREYNHAHVRYTRRTEIQDAPLEFDTLLADGQVQFKTYTGFLKLNQPM